MCYAGQSKSIFNNKTNSNMLYRRSVVVAHSTHGLVYRSNNVQGVGNLSEQDTLSYLALTWQGRGWGPHPSGAWGGGYC